jgi:P-type E1-E2 ATPase
MIEIEISEQKILRLQHLVSDVNGTLAVDGVLIEGVAEQIEWLKQHLTVHLLTADTHGKQAVIDRQLGLTAVRIQPGNEAGQKAEYVRRLGAENVVALGQGANDAAMLKEAALGLCVLSPEGTAVETLLAADLLLPDIHSALALFTHPLRIRASLRK